MPADPTVEDILLNGERAERIVVTHLDPPEGSKADRWAITLDIGWAETIVALCDYPYHARGVATALSETLGCELDLPTELEAVTGGPWDGD